MSPDSSPKLVVEALRVRPNKACELLDVGMTQLYAILPELDSYVEGNRRYITTASIVAYAARQHAEAKRGSAATASLKKAHAARKAACQAAREVG